MTLDTPQYYGDDGGYIKVMMRKLDFENTFHKLLFFSAIKFQVNDNRLVLYLKRISLENILKIKDMEYEKCQKT